MFSQNPFRESFLKILLVDYVWLDKSHSTENIKIERIEIYIASFKLDGKILFCDNMLTFSLTNILFVYIQFYLVLYSS